MSDYYRVLNVSRDASSAEIKAAYRKAALTCHPDRHASTGSADSQASMTTKFAQITEAYETLSDVQRRRVYDRDGRSAAARDPTGASYWRHRGAATSSTWSEAEKARYFYNGGSTRPRPGLRDVLFSILRVPRSNPFTRADAAMHLLMGGTLFAGLGAFGSFGDVAWQSQNKGRSFDDAMDKVKRARRKWVSEEP